MRKFRVPLNTNGVHSVKRGMKRTPLLFLPLFLLLGCQQSAFRTGETSNTNFQVELLFEYDGCRVYRFQDARPVYYVTCGNNRVVTNYAYSKNAGKHISTETVEVQTVAR